MRFPCRQTSLRSSHQWFLKCKPARQQGHSCHGRREQGSRCPGSRTLATSANLTTDTRGGRIPTHQSCPRDSHLPASPPPGPYPQLPHLRFYPPRLPAAVHSSAHQTSAPFHHSRANGTQIPQLRLTRNSQNGGGFFWKFINTAAVLNPENVDGLRGAHGLTGEVEGRVSGDIHALRLPRKVRKSCRGRGE